MADGLVGAVLTAEQRRDFDLGFRLCRLVSELPAPVKRLPADIVAVGEKARALMREEGLADRPVWTEEAVRDWLIMRNLGDGADRAEIILVLAALRHFAAPARVEMMIDAMTKVQIRDEMDKARSGHSSGYNWSNMDAAIVAHRFANTPKTPAPAPAPLPIEGMSEEDLFRGFMASDRSFSVPWPGRAAAELVEDTRRDCARLVRQWASRPDLDAAAKKMWGVFMRGINPNSTATDDEFWNVATQGDRAGIRAVVAAKEQPQ
jgi:hypothetical protein